MNNAEGGKKNGLSSFEAKYGALVFKTDVVITLSGEMMVSTLAE